MKVYLWGFGEAGMPQWPPDFEPLSTTDWPSDAPVVVDSGAVARFQAALAGELPARGRRPTAILYLRRDTAVPADVYTAFGGIVEETDWESLRALLEGPERFQIAALAHELPMTWLENLACPLEALRPDDLPLPAAVRHTLATSQTGWRAFLDTLAERLWLRQQLRGRQHRAAAPGGATQSDPTA
jgi:hypothetical protein